MQIRVTLRQRDSVWNLPALNADQKSEEAMKSTRMAQKRPRSVAEYPFARVTARQRTITTIAIRARPNARSKSRLAVKHQTAPVSAITIPAAARIAAATSIRVRNNRVSSAVPANIQAGRSQIFSARQHTE